MDVAGINIINHQVDTDFRRARSHAWRNMLLRPFRRRPTTLLPFKEVRASLHVQGQRDLGVQAVPLDQIIGSEGRSNDFDRDFLPRSEKLRDRWQRIGRARYKEVDLPPIQLFKIGDIYFVRDGNHRISVARQMGQRDIDAHVVEIETNVPLTRDLDLDDLDDKAAQSRFLTETGLLRLRPDFVVPVRASYPATYGELMRNVQGHHYFMGIDLKREVSWDEAVVHWYDEVYLPQVGAMRRLHTSVAFPRRTETNLFLSILKYRHYLTKQQGRDPGPEGAVLDFMARFGPWRFGRLRQVGSSVRKWLHQRMEWLWQGRGHVAASGDG